MRHDVLEFFYLYMWFEDMKNIQFKMAPRKKQARHLTKYRYHNQKKKSQSDPETEDFEHSEPSEPEIESTESPQTSIFISEEDNVTITEPSTSSITSTTVNKISKLLTDANIVSENNSAIELSNPNVLSDNTNTINIPETSENAAKIRLEKKRAQLIDKIKFLPDDEVAAAYHLFETMKYPSGKRKAKIFSPYIINKANTFITEGLNKHYSSITEIQRKMNLLKKENRRLQKEKEIAESQVHSLKMKVVKGEEAKVRYIKKIRSIAQQKKKISPEQFKKEAEKLIKVNKKEYTPQFVQLVTELSNTGIISVSSTVECTKKMYAFLTGEEPDKWISTGTVSRWNQEIARLLTSENLNADRESRFFTYGVMADESTRGEKKVFLICFAYWNNKKEELMLTLAKMMDINRCTGIEIANIVLQTCEEHNFDPARCNFWLTDNAAYMSGINAGAVARFNYQSHAQAYRIPCGIHSVHIAITKFEAEAFGKLNSSPGSLLIKHPANVLNLAYHLHDGYKDNDRGNPMNMKSDTIRKLYWTLLQCQLTQYQRPISTRWLYQLRTGEQYLERKDFHLRFASWLIPQLENSKNALSSYVQKWKVFQDWLQNPILNFQIKCMVTFGKKFYAEVITFLTGYDNTPRIMQNGTLIHLPAGNRAHELPDQILLWLSKLHDMSESPNEYFIEEFEEFSSILHENELQIQSLKLKHGIKAALESFSKWMECWIHLPLSVCRLGGDYGPEFARAVASKILNQTFENELTWREELYIKFLEEDFSKGIITSFGLFDALKEDNFLGQFIAFAKSQADDLHKFPLVYDFVKYKIWPIVVHQQQIEGLFNKYDIKTDPNQKTALQEARMQLACSTGEKSVTGEMLKEVRREIREESEMKEGKLESFGEEAAKSVLQAYVVFKK